MTTIQVFLHYQDLFPTETQGYRDRVEELLVTTFRHEPWYDWMIRGSLRHRCLGIPDDATQEITTALTTLTTRPVENVIIAAMTHLTTILPPPMGIIECHVVPGIERDFGGGASFAPGKMLLGLPLSEHWADSLRRNCAHEYSHTLRMAAWPQDTRHGFGEGHEYSIREYLVFEGAAECLAHQMYPQEHPDIGPMEERTYWDYIRPYLDEVGLPGYIRAMFTDIPGVPFLLGYRIAERIVAAYLQTTGHTAVTMQNHPFEAVYWQSNYPFLC